MTDKLAAEGAISSPQPKKCPTCDSPKPELHPSMQPDGGEVQLCKNPWHEPFTKAFGAISSPASQYDIRLMTDFQIVEILKARAAHDANNDFGRWIGRLLTAWVTDSPLADIDKILSERVSQGKHD